MTYLKKLEVDFVVVPLHRLSHVLPSMDGLERLCCSQPILFGPEDINISNMTQLTGLRLNYGKLQIPFGSFTGLVELDLYLHTRIDRGDGLSSMPLLESVRVAGLQQSCLENVSALRTLRWLKSLTLDIPVDVGGDYFPALGSLPELTFLKFLCARNTCSVSSLQQISLLNNLRALDCRQVECVEPLDYLLDGCLPRLRWLSIPGTFDSTETAKELRRRLPCLNRISGA